MRRVKQRTAAALVLAVLLLWKRAGSERRGWLEQTPSNKRQRVLDARLRQTSALDRC